MVGSVDLAGFQVAPGRPCFVIAEAGVNHNGELALAEQLVDAAATAKADAVKFQTFRAEGVVSPAAPKAAYQMETTDAGESQLDLLRRLELPPAAFASLQRRCRKRGLLFLSTPFDTESADLLERLDVPAFKIASGEVTNLPFLAYIGRKGRPVILSTGMSTLEEVRAAVETLRDSGTRQVILLHCVSNYPADPSDANLRAMATLASTFGTPVGYSDHTPGLEVALAAVALGACVVEKHFTLDRGLAGPDHRASLEPMELAALVRGIRIVETSLGDGCKRPVANEANTAAVARRSLVAARDIPSGTPLTEDLVAIKRPGTGLAPTLRSQLLGRVVGTDIAAGTLLTWEMVAAEAGTGPTTARSGITKEG